MTYTEHQLGLDRVMFNEVHEVNIVFEDFGRNTTIYKIVNGRLIEASFTGHYYTASYDLLEDFRNLKLELSLGSLID
jgi:hypothetical protein